MKTKREIVKELCDNGAVTFDEALILLDFEVDKPKGTHQVFNPYNGSIPSTNLYPLSGTINSSNTISTSNSDLENK